MRGMRRSEEDEEPDLVRGMRRSEEEEGELGSRRAGLQAGGWERLEEDGVVSGGIWGEPGRSLGGCVFS